MSDSTGATGSRPEAMLAALAVTVGYGAVPVVTGVSLQVAPGEVVAVVGPNGAGKSTLLKALVGTLNISSGRVLLAGEDVTHHAPEDLARRGLGYVPQVHDIFEPLTVFENLQMGGYLLDQAELPSRVKAISEIFPLLSPMLGRRADKLSGGERKMLAIARVLMLDPKVLILDEPTANLAPKVADALLRGQVRRLADRGKAIVLVEQRARSALEIADWAIVLVSGQTALEGPPSELLRRPDFEELFLGAGPPLSEASGD
ncbi:MAG: ABC transporter ATP-binding protein [Candidatus Acidiferrales bacterium]